MHRRLLVIGIAWCCLVSRIEAADPAAAATAPALPEQRWALLASEELRASAFADILAVCLADLPGLQWVERERLAEVADELVVSAVGGADGAESRLKLGKLLRADALLIVRVEGDGKAKRLRVIASDCATGARVGDELTAAPGNGDAEHVAAAVRGVVERTRIRFADGIRAIIGIPHFVSRNFGHEYDPLQAGFAQVLANALMTVPGIAVIEVEEARAISAELAGEPLGKRVVPAIVEGEYEMTRPADGGHEATASFWIGVTRGNGQRQTIVRRDLPPAKAAAFLGAELPPEILQSPAGAHARAPLPVERQFAILTDRAATFADLGAWDHSIPLREAALLLRPEAGEQRVSLTEEYVLILDRPVPRDLTGKEGRPALIVWHTGRVAIWRRARVHVEFLIRNRQITLEPLCRLMARHTSSLAWWPYEVEELVPGMRELARENDYFVRHVFPLALDLPRTDGAGELHSYRQWQTELLRAALARIDDTARRRPGSGVRAAELNVIADLAEGPLSDPKVGLFKVSDVIYDTAHKVARQEAQVTTAEFHAFLDRLSASRSLKVRLYGRLGRLWHEWAVSRGASDSSRGQLRAQAADLVAEVRDVFPRMHYASLDHYAELLVETIDRAARAAAEGTATTRAATRPAVARLARPTSVPANVEPLSFQPIVFHVRDAAGQTRPLGPPPPPRNGVEYAMRSVVPCGEAFDTFISPIAVYLHREKSVLEEILSDPAAEYVTAAWDGRHVWVGSRRRGLFILSGEGAVRARVTDEQGLPPADRAMLIHPLAGGKALIVGCHGEHARAWFAVVEVTEVGVKVNVFHQATRVVNAGDHSALNDPSLCFFPTFVQPMKEPAESGGERVLVGRASGASNASNLPLEIDLGGLTVAVRRHNALMGHSQDYYFLDDFRVLKPTGQQLMLLDHRPLPPALRPNPAVFDLGPMRGGRFGDTVLEYRGQVYVTGDTWCRVDPVTLTMTALAPRDPDPPRPFGATHALRYAVSAHYGPILWQVRDQSFHAVRVDGEE